MVGNTRGTTDTRRIRRLKPPQAVEVEAGEDGSPRRLRLGSAWRDVVLARRPWRVDQHWWRGKGVSRVYYRVSPENGPPLTIYHDFIGGEWFRQEY